MQKKLVILMVLFFAAGAAGCSFPHKGVTSTNFWSHERPYTVCGRVVNVEQAPVENCRIYLIKRKYNRLCPTKAGRQGELIAQMPVAVTDKTGNFSFVFEPLGANNFWVYVEAEDAGYKSRFVELDYLMGPTLFQTPGNTPIVVGMVLERTS